MLQILVKVDNSNSAQTSSLGIDPKIIELDFECLHCGKLGLFSMRGEIGCFESESIRCPRGHKNPHFRGFSRVDTAGYIIDRQHPLWR